MTPFQLIYISGMPHSGSTLLDLACSSGGVGLSLGEVRQTILKPEAVGSNYCSCGAKGVACAFWGSLLPTFKGASVEDSYQRVMSAAQAFMPEAMFVIDSSKSRDGLNLAQPFEPVVLQVVKDVRAYIVSTVDNAARKHRPSISVFREIRRWSRRNAGLCRMAADLGLRHMTVSYDRLCTDSVEQSGLINRFVNARAVDAENLLGSTNHHVLVGNRMKNSHNGVLRYDQRWKSRDDWVWGYALQSGVRRYNSAVLNGD
jgi:hypothetical protein